MPANEPGTSASEGSDQGKGEDRPPNHYNESAAEASQGACGAGRFFLRTRFDKEFS
jgi:hypothetical protein